MTPAAHIAAAIEILDLILAGANVETSLTKWRCVVQSPSYAQIR